MYVCVCTYACIHIRVCIPCLLYRDCNMVIFVLNTSCVHGLVTHKRYWWPRCTSCVSRPHAITALFIYLLCVERHIETRIHFNIIGILSVTLQYYHVHIHRYTAILPCAYSPLHFNITMRIFTVTLQYYHAHIQCGGVAWGMHVYIILQHSICDIDCIMICVPCSLVYVNDVN
jgi:hypothetical protein